MAVGQFVTDPDTQVVAPVLNLLSEVPDPAAAALTLRMLSADSDNKYLRRAASSVAAVKLARGHFDDAALPRLESHVLGALRRGESLDGRLDAFDLAVRLPEDSWARVDGGLRTRRAHGLVPRPGSATSWSPPPGPPRWSPTSPRPSRPTPASHQPQEPDLMLRRLLREALLHSHKPRRHHAALLIAASPYATATARHCLRVASDSNELLAARAWTVLMRVGDGGQRERGHPPRDRRGAPVDPLAGPGQRRPRRRAHGAAEPGDRGAVRRRAVPGAALDAVRPRDGGCARADGGSPSPTTRRRSAAPSGG